MHLVEALRFAGFSLLGITAILYFLYLKAPRPSGAKADESLSTPRLLTMLAFGIGQVCLMIGYDLL